jgi:ATP-binding cassette subfamily B protein
MSINRYSWESLLLGFYTHIGLLRKRQILVLFLLTLITSASEVVSLGAVVPFIGILTQPTGVQENAIFLQFFKALNARPSFDLVYLLAGLFGLAALVAATMRLLLLRYSIRVSNEIGIDISVEVYRRTLYQPYEVHIARSSSEIISGITQKVAVVSQVFNSLVTVSTALVMFVAILVTLIWISPIAAFISFISFGVSYFVIAVLTSGKLKSNSQAIALQQTSVVKVLQEGLGAIREVLIDGTQNLYINSYKNFYSKMQKASGENLYFNLAPRYLMEGLGMLLIAFIACVLAGQPGGMSAYLPVLAALGLGAQRLMPLLQQIYGNWSVIVGNKSSLVEVLFLLEQQTNVEGAGSDEEVITLRNNIYLRNITFQYSPDTSLVFHKLNLKITKGMRIGLIGPTGGGKSTLVDILMGLLKPTDGVIEVDGVAITSRNMDSWRACIAHVPQSIYLSDGTIEENIAFGVPSEAIDSQKIKLVAKQAQIAEKIDAMPKNYQTIVGERGVRLSGGERQRVGIARALYKNAQVIVFDEATSALDPQTEEAVMGTIDSLRDDLTIIVVAHRLTTLRNCDVVIEIGQCGVVRSGLYSEMINNKK